MKVIIRQHIYSERPAEPGIWCIETTRDLVAVPHSGDWAELAPGWSSARIRDVTFMADGSVIAELDKEKTNSPAILAEHHQLADEHGWEWVGNAPERVARSQE